MSFGFGDLIDTPVRDVGTGTKYDVTYLIQVRRLEGVWQPKVPLRFLTKMGFMENPYQICLSLKCERDRL